MNNIRDYWRRVRQAEAELPNVQAILIVSIESAARGMRGGRVCAVNREGAAIRIVDGTHRLATDDEIQAHIADEQSRSNQAQADALQRAGRTIVSIPARVVPEKKAPGERGRG
ncbi:MAG: hypothetical protein ACKV22_09790 [Bryobacteraceae bacterium]